MKVIRALLAGNAGALAANPLLLLSLSCAFSEVGRGAESLAPVTCEGAYPFHLQGDKATKGVGHVGRVIFARDGADRGLVLEQP